MEKRRIRAEDAETDPVRRLLKNAQIQGDK
jgi:hypothetical protein